MIGNSLDLKLSKSNLSLFSDIAAAKFDIEKSEKLKSLAEFTKADEFEIGRGKTYAVFKELKNDVNVTIESFRNGLATRGLLDTELQNKILCMTLQTKVGIPFALGNIINSLFLNNKHNLLMNPDYELALEVNNDKKVTLTLKGFCDAIINIKDPAISFSISVAITPASVVISNFTITQLSDSQEASNAYKFLEDNQQNILEKIVSYIKQFFGFNSELKLEDSNDQDFSCSCIA